MDENDIGRKAVDTAIEAHSAISRLVPNQLRKCTHETWQHRDR
ncbi:MAG: hypothetical protein P8184_19045 [Calditrichia bacterium]